MTDQARKIFTEFISSFSEYQKNIYILTDDSEPSLVDQIEHPDKAIIIVQTKSICDSYVLKRILKSHINRHCILIMAESINAFRTKIIESEIGIRVRQVIFPLLDNADGDRYVAY